MNTDLRKIKKDKHCFQANEQQSFWKSYGEYQKKIEYIKLAKTLDSEII